MKITNDRTYDKGMQITIPLVLSVFAFDLIKATFDGRLRESSWTLKILSSVSSPNCSHCFGFCLNPCGLNSSPLWTELDSYLFLLLGALALAHLMKGPFLSHSRSMMKWCCWRIDGSNSAA